MPRTTLAGHPLHPQLIPFPAALLPTSLAFDLLHLATGRRTFDDTARHTLAAGLLGAAAAGTAGALDYLSIPPGGATKRVANVHAALNISLVGVFGVSWLLRRERPSATALLLSASAMSACSSRPGTAATWCTRTGCASRGATPRPDRSCGRRAMLPWRMRSRPRHSTSRRAAPATATARPRSTIRRVPARATRYRTEPRRPTAAEAADCRTEPAPQQA